MAGDRPSLAFFLDVDNTLLDNDAAKAELSWEIRQLLGAVGARNFWDTYEHRRRTHDLVDYPATLQQFRARYPDARNFPQVADLVLGYGYNRVVYPGALETVQHLRRLGKVAIVSDGDPVYQAAKIARAGLAQAVHDEVVLYAHKELHLHDVCERYAADHYVMVDDKPRILAAAKHILGAGLTTVFVNQGHYAQEERDHYPTADLSFPAIADLAHLSATDFLNAAQSALLPE